MAVKLRIGVDLDNTIAIYDSIVGEIVLEKFGIDCGRHSTKTGVAALLRSKGRERDWTITQGLMYGEKMKYAELANGSEAVLESLLKQNHTIKIISHRSLRPDSGLDYNLHTAAYQWVRENLRNLFELHPDSISLTLCETKEIKIASIKASNLDFFIDDLPAILTHSKFPKATTPILYNPESDRTPTEGILSLRSWYDLEKIIRGKY